MAKFTADDFKSTKTNRFTADMFTASGYAEYERRKKEEEERRAFNNTFAPKIVTTPSATTGGLPETNMKVNVASSLDMFRNQAPNATPKPSQTDAALTNIINGRPAWAAKENEPLVPKRVDFSRPEAQAKVNVMSAFLASQAKQAQTTSRTGIEAAAPTFDPTQPTKTAAEVRPSDRLAALVKPTDIETPTSQKVDFKKIDTSKPLWYES